MAVIAAIGSLVLGAIGTFATISAMKKQAKAAKRIEALRERQMRLEAARRRRQIIRQALISRSRIAASAQSAGIYNASPTQGGLGAISSITAGNVGAVSQNEMIGSQIFAARRDMIDAQSSAATASALVGFGQGLFRNLAGISRVFG